MAVAILNFKHIEYTIVQIGPQIRTQWTDQNVLHVVNKRPFVLFAYSAKDNCR